MEHKLEVKKNNSIKKLFKILNNKIFTEVWFYRLDIDNINFSNMDIYNLHKYNLKELTSELLDKMYNQYKDELSLSKYELLRTRINNISYRPYIVQNSEGSICGYYHLCFSEIIENCVNLKRKMENGYVYLSDAYTFKNHRRKGAQEFALVSLIRLSQKFNTKYAVIAAMVGNTPSEKTFMKYGFKIYMKCRYLHISDIKKTFVIMIKNKN